MGVAIDKQANAAVEEAIARAIEQRSEIGIQVAAYLHGELVIDAWGGVADPNTGRPVDSDTLFNVFSVTKGVVATALHLQAERGLVDYDRPVCEYWPDYGANGKQVVTVRDALSHRTGTPQMPEGVTVETIGNWDAMAAGCAQQAPMFPVGSPAYQSFSFGWVIGEIVRRTDPHERSFRDFVQQEICDPFDIPDLWIGVDPQVEPRIARLTNADAGHPVPEAGSTLERSMPNAIRLIPEVYEQSAMRQACVPGTGGIFTARSCARFWAILANGGELDGKRLLSRARIDMACERRPGAMEPDPVYFGAIMPLSQGGYWLYDGAMPITCPVKSPRAICSPGVGGSLGWADPETGLAVAFCHNYMSNPQDCDAQPASNIADTIRSSLGLG
jgi:CubicO group peptidase (beta-lactamase class C family)